MQTPARSLSETMMNWGRFFGCALLLAASAGLAANANAQQPQQGPPAASATPSSPATPSPASALEPKAIDLLKASSQRLAAARSMTFTAVVSYENPSRLGPPLIYTTRSDVTLQRPNRLRVITPGDGPASEFYYDGKTVVAFAPAENLVAVAEAPPTIDATLEAAYHYAAIYFPFSDVMVSDPYEDIAKSLELAFYIGQSREVGGTTTDMVAYVAHGVFVQIWIGAEDRLPRRARAVFRNDPVQLRHQVEFSHWQLDGAIPADAFASAKAGSATRIPFARPDAKLPPGATAPATATSSKTQ
jgi:hypothetical protein